MVADQPKPKYKTSELMTHSTTRIQCTFPGDLIGTGTAFFFQFRGEDYLYPLLVTNKHVIKDPKAGECLDGHFVLSKIDESGNRLHQDQLKIGFKGYSNGWIPHPEPSVDLAILPLAPWLSLLQERKTNPFIVYNDIGSMPTEEEWQDLSPIEKITMVGYPDGIWDEQNNLPITRQGHTATSPKMDYNGKQFLIDAAVYSGSSGSPVYLYDESVKLKKVGTETKIGQVTIVKLLGILSAVRTQSWQGEIATEDIPIARVPIAKTAIPINLGVVIKSTRLLDFEPILKRMDS